MHKSPSNNLGLGLALPGTTFFNAARVNRIQKYSVQFVSEALEFSQKYLYPMFFVSGLLIFGYYFVLRICIPDTKVLIVKDFVVHMVLSLSSNNKLACTVHTSIDPTQNNGKLM